MKKIIVFFIALVSFLTVNAQWSQTNGINPLYYGYNNYVTSILGSGIDMYAGANDGIYKSTDNGSTWNIVNSNLNFVYSLVNNGNDVISGSLATIDISNNSGLNWNSITITDMGSNDMVINDTIIYACTNGGIYIASTNNDTSWTLLSSFVCSCLVFDGDIIFAGTNGNGVYKSTNNGLTWINQNTGIFPYNSNFLYINSIIIKDSDIYVGTNNGVCKSALNLIYWVSVNNGLSISSTTVNTLLLNNNILYAGTNGGMFSLSGTIWSSYGLTDSVFSLTIHNNVMFAGTNNGIWKRSLITNVNEELSNTNDINIYPNHSTGLFNIQTSSNVEVYNISGSLVYSDNNITEMNLSNLSSGVYLTKITNGNKVNTQKIIIEK